MKRLFYFLVFYLFSGPFMLQSSEKTSISSDEEHNFFFGDFKEVRKIDRATKLEIDHWLKKFKIELASNQEIARNMKIQYFDKNGFIKITKIGIKPAYATLLETISDQNNYKNWRKNQLCSILGLIEMLDIKHKKHSILDEEFIEGNTLMDLMLARAFSMYKNTPLFLKLPYKNLSVAVIFPQFYFFSLLNVSVKQVKKYKENINFASDIFSQNMYAWDELRKHKKNWMLYVDDNDETIFQRDNFVSGVSLDRMSKSELKKQFKKEVNNVFSLEKYFPKSYKKLLKWYCTRKAPEAEVPVSDLEVKSDFKSEGMLLRLFRLFERK